MINDVAFISAVTADACFMVHLVCLLIKTHLALLQYNCFDLVCCASLPKLSGCMRNITVFSQHLLRPINSAILADANISEKPKYWPTIAARSIYQSISKINEDLLMTITPWLHRSLSSWCQ